MSSANNPLHTTTAGTTRTLEEQKALLQRQLKSEKSIPKLKVHGGTLQDRLRLLQDQREKDAAKISYTTDASQVTDELIRDRVKWLQQQQNDGGGVEKKSIHVQGGNLQDRLRLLEEQKKRDAAKLTSMTTDESQVTQNLIRDRLKDLEEQRKKDSKGGPSSYTTTDESQVTQDLIRERLKDLEEQRKKDAEGTSYTTDESHVTQDLIRERLKDLEEQRKKDAEGTSYTTDESQVTQDLIRERLKDLEEQRKKDAEGTSYATDESRVTQDLIRERLKDLEEQRKQDATFTSHATDELQVTQDLIRDRLKDLALQNQKNASHENTKEAIVIQGGNLKERLELLETQRLLDAQQGRFISTTSASDVTYDFVHDRLHQIQAQLNNDAISNEEREAVIVEGGKLADRLQKLEQSRERDTAKLVSYTTSLSNVTDDLIQDRLSWLAKQQDEQTIPQQAQDVVSHDLVAERMVWLKESAAKANALPEKERLEATRDLVKQRQAWLDEAKLKAAELPKKEKIEVTQGLLNERIAWLEAEKEKASSLNHEDRIEMTTGLIAERLEWLEQQYALDASEDIEMQITFLSEQKANAQQMTQEEQMVMANALLDEKKQDLENQRELTAELSEEQITEVAGLLIDDRQAWLEGNEDKPSSSRATVDEAVVVDEDEDPIVAENSAAMQEVADSISFWAEQKKIAASMNANERSEITSLLIQEHIAGLEEAAKEAQDDETKESIQIQIEFLREQSDNLDSIDHMTMINALIDEKIAGLERRLAALYERVSALCVIS